jgi:hypothetical protein
MSKLVLASVKQHPDLLSQLSGKDANEYPAALSAGVVLLDLGILHSASARQRQSFVGCYHRELAVELGARHARLNPEIHSAFSQSAASILATPPFLLEEAVNSMHAVLETFGEGIDGRRVRTSYMRFVGDICTRLASWASNRLLGYEILARKRTTSTPLDTDFDVPPFVSLAPYFDHNPSMFRGILA